MGSSFIHSHNLSDYWAKSTGESIGTHTRRVLENLRQIRDRTPEFDRFSESPRFWSRAALTVCLHDLGKCCDGFQAVVHNGQRFSHRHEVLSAIFIGWVLHDYPEDAKWVAAAVLTHHKDWPYIDEKYGPKEYDLPDGLEVLLPQMSTEFFFVAERIVREEVWPDLLNNWAIPEEWGRAVAAEWIPGDPLKELRSAVEMARAVVSQNQRLNSEAANVLQGIFLRGVIIIADHSGSAWENLRVLDGLENPQLARIVLGLPNVEDIYPHQAEIAEQEGNAILIAPTGSGKTEGALFWVSRQNSVATGQPVVYYILPYQASLNAMYRRLSETFTTDPIALQHSRAVQALYRQLLDKAYTPDEAQRSARREQNLASLYVKPLRISTPYQILKGSFQLRGHESLWTAAAQALLILDEIHVYETARLAIILATLRHLCLNLGGSSLIMSATLPSYLSDLLTKLLRGKPAVRATGDTLKAFRRHEIRLLDEDLLGEAVTESALADADNGMGVLIVATTVGRAQRIWERLRKLANCQILHGRFHADDRASKETDLLAIRGVNSARPRQGVILVATQVVEVSLNVDFDVLYSDPAPLEALLQRFGRVNRKGRKFIESIKRVNVCRKIPDGSPVYPDFLVRKALDVLEPWEGKVLQEERLQAMVDDIYIDGLGSRLSHELEQGIERFSRDVLSTCRPFSSDEKIEELFDDMFDGFEVLPITLKHEYERRLEEEPLLAPGLLIPITKGQYVRLKSRSRLKRLDSLNVVDCRYSEIGLELDGPPSEDGI